MLPKLRILISYAYARNTRSACLSKVGRALITTLSPYCSILVDSGAYTNMKKGKDAALHGKTYNPITVEEYTRQMTRVSTHLWDYIMMDALKQPQPSRDNLRYMRDSGLDPMPVYVEGMTPEDIPFLLDRPSKRRNICVAIGSSGNDYLFSRILQVHNASNYTALIHALGYSNVPDVFRLPLHSFDSSTYTNGSKWGALTLYTRDRFVSYREGCKLTPSRRQAFISNGIDMDTVFDPRFTHGAYGAFSYYTIRSFLRFAAVCESRGSRYFFAVSNTSWLVLLACTVATYDGGERRYLEWRAKSQRLAAMWRSDKPRAISHLAQMLKQHTDWRMP